MHHLYAPWRETFIKSEKPEHADANSCVFCKQLAAQEDERYFVLHRFSHVALIMNLYPYNAGHLMVLPYAHTGEVTDLDTATHTQLFQVATQTTTVLRGALHAQGFNLGINMGAASGGGIPHHLHVHVLPRWKGDTNFLETLADTKVISSDLHALYKTLHTACQQADWKV